MSALPDSLPDGLFMSGEVHAREIELANGERHTLYFREVPEAVFRRFYAEQSSSIEAVADLSVSRLIAASLCEPDGKPALTIEQAVSLKPRVASRIVPMIMQVNGFGEVPGKN